MQSAASLASAPAEASWRISRDGSVIALVDVRHEGGVVIVSVGPPDAAKLHNFDSLQSADGFMADLLASFAYLGCEVAKA